MEFPITELLDHDSSVAWIMEHFHPDGLKCPKCGQPQARARQFRRTRRSRLIVYRCRGCQMTYNLYSGTVFRQTHLTPTQVVLLLRGICKGESSKELAAELKLNYQALLTLRHEIQQNAEQAQPNTPLPDQHTETDEMFQNAGEKRGRTL
jgi:transposase-like protein